MIYRIREARIRDLEGTRHRSSSQADELIKLAKTPRRRCAGKCGVRCREGEVAGGTTRSRATATIAHNSRNQHVSSCSRREPRGGETDHPSEHPRALLPSVPRSGHQSTGSPEKRPRERSLGTIGIHGFSADRAFGYSLSCCRPLPSALITHSWCPSCCRRPASRRRSSRAGAPDARSCTPRRLAPTCRPVHLVVCASRRWASPDHRRSSRQ